MKKIFLSFILLILSVLSLTSCKKENDKDTLIFAYTAGNIRVAIVQLASELGYFEEEGVKVEFVNLTGTEALTALSLNKDTVDILGTGIVPDLSFIAQGNDLTIFGGTAAEGGAIISKKENVETYKDITKYNNIKVGMVRNESTWIVLRQYILDNYKQIDISSISITYFDSQVNVAQAVDKGEVTLGFLPLEYATSYKDSLNVGVVYEAGELSPEYVCCRQVTSTKKLAEKRDAFVAFERAQIRAWEIYENEANREEVLTKISKFSGQTTDFINNYLFVNRTKLTTDPSKKNIITYYNSLVNSGFFKDIDLSTLNIENHIDTSVYKQALDDLIARNNSDWLKSKLDLYNQFN